MSEQELIGWLALKRVSGLGDLGLKRLMEAFGSSQAVFSASPKELAAKAECTDQAVRGIRDPSIQHQAQNEMKAVQKADACVITLLDPKYPRALSAIYDPPPLLYLQGELRPEDDLAMAIVGSRQASSYGTRIAEEIAEGLASYGFSIVSGLARGIDSAAHRGALSAGGRTLAVLGCGLDILYPSESRRLREKITEQGAVLSEFPMGIAPKPTHFPRRNRAISGLSSGTLVVEAAQRSGSLITARCALEQGREVFAIPGNLGAVSSQGTNRLIQCGAKLVQGVEDILEELRPQVGPLRRPVPQSQKSNLEPQETTLYEMLSSEQPRHINELITESRLPSAQISGILLQLELKGTIRHLSGQRYVRT